MNQEEPEKKDILEEITEQDYKYGFVSDIDVEEFIAVKGYKAKGKRVTTSKVKEFRWLEPRPEPEPEPEEEQPEPDLNTVDEEREGFAEGTQTSLF